MTDANSVSIPDAAAAILTTIRARHKVMKAAAAKGVINEVDVNTDVEFLLNYIDAQASLVIETFEGLNDYLQALNYEYGQDSTSLTTRDGALFFAFCTDPDGAWVLETGDPTERFEEEGDSFVYVPLELDFIQNRGPFMILYKAAK